MKKSSKTILKYFLEFFIVAFGVFLGVYVSEWNFQKKTDANTEKTLNFIVDEMSVNITKLETSIDYQEDLIKSIDSLIALLNKDDFEAIFYTNKKFKFNKLPNYKGLRFSNCYHWVHFLAVI